MIGSVQTPFGKMAQNEERWRGYLQGIRSGDRQSLAQFYDETSAVVYGLVLRIVDEPTAAADVTLEVYQQAWASPGILETAGSVLASLTLFTRRKALEHVRSAKTSGKLREQGGGAPPAAPGFALGRERDLVIRALALLDPAQREAIELAFFSGMPDVQLAQTLGTTPEAIRARISAGMRKLNEALKLVSAREGNA